MHRDERGDTPCGRGPATPIRSAPPTTARAPTSRSSPRSPSGSSCACSTSARHRRRRVRCTEVDGVRLARLPARRRARASATATGCTGPYDPAHGLRCNPAKLLLDPYAKAIDGPVDVGRGGVRLPVRRPGRRATTPTRRRTCRSRVVVNPFFDWGNDRPPRIPYHETVIYEAHVEGLTDAPPGHPRGAARHLRRPRAPGDDRPPDAARRHRGRAACRCTSSSTTTTCVEQGPAQLLGLQHHRLLRPAPRATRRRAAGRAAGAGVQGDGARPCTTRASR